MSAYRGSPEMKERYLELRKNGYGLRSRSSNRKKEQSPSSPLCYNNAQRPASCSMSNVSLSIEEQSQSQAAADSLASPLLDTDSCLQCQEKQTGDKKKNTDLREQPSCSDTQWSSSHLNWSSSLVQSNSIDTVETVMTCEGDLNSPHFKRKFAALKTRLTRLLKTSRRSINVKKMEPWNSVKVTMQLPRRLAEKLKRLAENDAELLRSLGVLGIQVQGDRHINLQINNPATVQISNGASQNSIVSIINQLVGDNTKDEQQDVMRIDSACSSSSQTAAISTGLNSVVHLPTCAYIQRQSIFEGGEQKVSVAAAPSSSANATPQQSDADADDDQVVCTCGASASSPTPASSSNSAASANAFTVPANNSVLEQRRRGSTLDGENVVSSNLELQTTKPNSPLRERAVISNGSSTPEPLSCGDVPLHRLNVDSHSKPVSAESCDQRTVATAVTRTPTGGVTRPQSMNAVPPSLSNFVAVDFAGSGASPLCFTLNDDNILDDSICMPRPLDCAHSETQQQPSNCTSLLLADTLRVEKTPAFELSAANSVLTGLLRDEDKLEKRSSVREPQSGTGEFDSQRDSSAESKQCDNSTTTEALVQPQGPAVTTSQSRTAHTSSHSEKVQIIRMPLRTETISADVDEPARTFMRSGGFSNTNANANANASLGLATNTVSSSASNNSQVRIIQIPSKPHAANNHVSVNVAAAKNSSSNTLPIAQSLSSITQHAALNGVLINGTRDHDRESSLNCSVSNKRIRIETNSRSHATAHRGSESDDDAFS